MVLRHRMGTFSSTRGPMKHVKVVPLTPELMWAGFLETCKSSYEELVALLSQLALELSEAFTDLMNFLRGQP